MKGAITRSRGAGPRGSGISHRGQQIRVRQFVESLDSKRSLSTLVCDPFLQLVSVSTFLQSLAGDVVGLARGR